jgi:hypothetical protein
MPLPPPLVQIDRCAEVRARSIQLNLFSRPKWAVANQICRVQRNGPALNNPHYLSLFTKSKIWSVSRVSAVLIE